MNTQTTQYKASQSFLELWDKYTAYKAQTVEQTTIQTTFRRVRNTIIEYGDKPVLSGGRWHATASGG